MVSAHANLPPPPGCVSGHIYHNAGPLHPPLDQQLRHAQIYVLDLAEATHRRCRNGEVFDSRLFIAAFLHVPS